MEKFLLPIQLRWADIDANFHVRHSVYYDWGAMCRMEFLRAMGLTESVFHQLQIGPILFREESRFKRELQMGDTVAIDLHLLAARRDFSRWTIRHQLFKNKDTLAAILTVEGAFLNTQLRKLAVPPSLAGDTFNSMPRAEEFTWLD
jgi:acyl-CoA thioester hydrolase